ncbi:hypothetical protein SUGI_1167310 [Cryptomeria japonica]|nr:hypothetical protein SUGI_1167310 [Cryptomeria japonica]
MLRSLNLRCALPVNRMAWRAFSDGKGKVFSEEEKAAENIYIKKMEKERLEKLKQKQEKEVQVPQTV